MEIPASVLCPYCGQAFEFIIDTSVGAQTLVTDCEICCRPLGLEVECEPGEILLLNVTQN